MMLMKVIIVDDDSLVRIGLKSIINWKENGFELVGEASDGSKALDLVLAYNPDIIITDIKMPVMDGLELMRKLAEMKNGAKILVLSSYDDFHLVKEAMKLGAEDYLLKLEIEPEALINILIKIACTIEEERQKEDEQVSRENQLLKNINVMRRNFLRDVVNHFYADERDLKESMDFLNIRLNTEYIYCIMIKIGELYRFEDTPDEKLHVLNFSIINIVEEIVNDIFNGYCFEGKTGEFFLLASGKKEQNGAVGEQKLVDLGKRLRDMLEQYLNITATIGIGEGKGGTKGIRDAYNQAVNAVRCRFFDGNEGVILWKDIKPNVFQTEKISILNMKERLHNALSFQQKQELDAVFKSIQEDLSELPLSKNAICNMTLELFYMLSEFFELYQINMNEIMSKSYRSYEQLVHMASVDETRKWIQEVMEDLVSYIEKEEKTGYSRIISRAKKYVENHFNEDISLKEAADEVNLNPSYFSTLLKKYTGLSYSEYLIQVRVEKAKGLLAKSDYKVYEVGEKVGYQNIYYFNRIFKKVTGLSPGEYKKKRVNSAKVQRSL